VIDAAHREPAAVFAADLAMAERRLRAHGLTGVAAFEALRDTLLHRAGRGGRAHPALATLTLPEADLDLLGLAYERFFPDLFKGRLGQYFTPQPLVDLLLARVQWREGLEVLDPTCGSGGLLVRAARRGAVVRGIDVDPRMADLARLNLALAGVEASITTGDFFTTPPEPVDVLLANPPFSLPIRDQAVLERFDSGRGRAQVSSDGLFVEAIADWVRPGGLAALVLPWTVVANPAGAELRAQLDTHWVRRALCALPEGVFRPFGGAGGRAALVWLQRRPCDEGPMAWSEVVDPGYDVRSTRLFPTDSTEIQARIAGRGWRPIRGWLPSVEGQGTTVAELATVATHTQLGGPDQRTIDLADTDRRTGEVHPRIATNRGRRVVLEPGMVLVSRMRPDLGNVVIVPPGDAAVGSPEWIRLCSAHPHVLLHLLRTPTFRAQLPPTTGQTRPRTGTDAVLSSALPMPEPAVRDRLERVSAALYARRRRLLDDLERLQAAVDAFAADPDDAVLRTTLDALEDA
jgi:SAM-dependent methyltransferase